MGAPNITLVPTRKSEALLLAAQRGRYMSERLHPFVALLALMLPFMGVAAAPELSPYQRQAALSLRAFECSMVAPEEKETERLFNLGLKAGREFISYADRFPEKIREKSAKIPLLWLTIQGPTPDFVLGQIYAHIEKDLYWDYDGDEKQWNIKRKNLYREKNCALLQ